MRNIKEALDEYLGSLNEECLLGVRLRSGLPAIRSTLSHLESVGVLDGNPNTLIHYFMSQFYEKNTIIRNFRLVAQFWSAAKVDTINPYTEFRKKHKNKAFFRENREPKPAKFSFQELEQNIIYSNMRIDVKKMALTLLYSGMRFNEAKTFKDGVVMGKGKKTRAVHFIKEIEVGDISQIDYSSVYYYLKGKIGVTPHDLRRAYALEAVRLGMNPFKLRYVMGHSSLLTTQRYVDSAKL